MGRRIRIDSLANMVVVVVVVVVGWWWGGDLVGCLVVTLFTSRFRFLRGAVVHDEI